MITPSTLAIILQGAPFPDAVFTVTPGGAAIDITADGATITFCEGAWFAAERRTTPAHLSFAATPTAEQVHTEIRRVLAIVNAPADDPLYDRAAAAQTLAKVTGAHAVVSQRLIGSQKEVAERDATIEELRSALEAIAGHVGADPWAVEEIKVKVAEVVVKAGAVPALEKCVARLTEERDRARFTGQRLTHAAQNACRVLTDAGVAPPIKSDPADKAEARVKRLRKSINAAHAVLDEAGIGLEPEGSPRWTLARRCRAAVAPVWGYLDAMQAFDVVGEIVGVTGKTGERGFIDAVIARVKALRNDDDTRAAIAVAVGLDGSASLALILDMVKVSKGDKLTAYDTLAALLLVDAANPATVVKALHELKSRIKIYEVTEERWEADNATCADLLRLVSYHQAPIKFNARPLTLAERASFVIRRLWQGRTNAANEAAALRRELGDIEAALGDLPDTAEREPIGDREEHLGLSAAERIRLAFTH